jgi:HEAT repeat protein
MEDYDRLEVGESPIQHNTSWQPNTADVETVVRVLDKISLGQTETETRCSLIAILGNSRDPLALNPLLGQLNDSDKKVRYAAIEALGMLGDVRVVEPLLKQLDDTEEQICISAAIALSNLNNTRSFAALHELLKNASPRKRQAAVDGLARKRDKTDRQLLSRDIDASKPWLDPQEPITAARVAKAARELKLSEEEVRLRYQALAADFLLQLDWCGEHGE